MKTLYNVLAVASASLLPIAGITQNLVLNPGFETATIGVPTGTPLPSYPATLDSWGAVNTDGEFILGPTQSHSGNGFMSMLENGGQNPGTPWLGTTVAGGFDRGEQEVDVLANTTYLLNYWYRAGDGSRYGYGAGSTLVQVEEVLPTNLSLASVQNVATGIWQQGTITFTTGPATTRIMVLFSAMGSGPTDTWYDDIDLHGGQGEGVIEHELVANWIFDAANGSLVVEPTTTTNDYWIDVHDAAGARVGVPTSQQGERWTIDLSGLSNGAYIAVLHDPESRSVYKLVLAR